MFLVGCLVHNALRSLLILVSAVCILDLFFLYINSLFLFFFTCGIYFLFAFCIIVANLFQQESSCSIVSIIIWGLVSISETCLSTSCVNSSHCSRDVLSYWYTVLFLSFLFVSLHTILIFHDVDSIL